MGQENLKDFLRLFSFHALPTREELKRRYRHLMKLHHPDRNPDGLPSAARLAQELNLAYEAIERSLPAAAGEPAAAAPQPPPGPAGPSVLAAIRGGDQALERAVLSGCLTRQPRNVLAAGLRERLSGAARTLQELEKGPEAHPGQLFQAAFFRELFLRFLQATDPGILLQGLASAHPTLYFRRLRQANSRLDAGVRAFYHYRARGLIQVGTLAEIPSSHLLEAGRTYEGLLAESGDPNNRTLLEARFELSRLFLQRLQDPRLAGA